MLNRIALLMDYCIKLPRNRMWPFIVAVYLFQGLVDSKEPIRTKRAMDPEAFMNIVSYLLVMFKIYTVCCYYPITMILFHMFLLYFLNTGF